MTTQDPLEFLRQTEQRRSEQHLELVTDVMGSFRAMQEAEQSLYRARQRYIQSFKRAAQEHWKAKELREAGFPAPKVSVLKRRMDVRNLMTAPTDASPRTAPEGTAGD